MSVLPEKMVMISQVQNLKRSNISAYQIMKNRKEIKCLVVTLRLFKISNQNHIWQH